MVTQTKKPAKRMNKAHHNGRRFFTNSFAYKAGEAVGGMLKLLKDARRTPGGRYPHRVSFRSTIDLAELNDLFSAEEQLLDALLKTAKAGDFALAAAVFEHHRREAVVHVKLAATKRSNCSAKSQSKTRQAMKGLIAEGDDWIVQPAEPGSRTSG